MPYRGRTALLKPESGESRISCRTVLESRRIALVECMHTTCWLERTAFCIRRVISNFSADDDIRGAYHRVEGNAVIELAT